MARLAILSLFMGQTRNRFLQYQQPRTILEILDMAGRTEGCEGVELRYPGDLADPKAVKAALERNNLGIARRDAETRRAQAEITNLNGRAARQLVEAFPDAVVFYEEKLNFRAKGKVFAASVNRKLGRWAKRDLSRRIELHVSASGARREFVNAAFTSQECPRCHWTDRGNRSGISFACEHCSYAGKSDAVASSNVRSRGSDQTVTLFTPVNLVRDTLASRHSRWRAEHADTDARCASRGLIQNDQQAVPAGSQLTELPF